MVHLTRIDLESVSEKLGAKVDFVSAPGGRDRKTIVGLLDGRRVVVSKRRSEARAQLEADILRHLGPERLAPRLIKRADDVLVQEFVEGQRLPVRLHQLPAAHRGDLIRQSVETMIAAQSAGARAGLTDLVPEIGVRPGWTRDLAASPTRLLRALNLDAPSHDFGALLDSGETGRTCFIKWDARPGNFMVRPDGSVCLFDWEHAGRRRPIDDLAWFFADEWMPGVPDLARPSVAKMARARGLEPEREWHRFQAMAVAHSCIRLHLILTRKKEGDWWNFEACLQRDRVGVTAGQVRLVAERSARWAEGLAGLRPLAEALRRVPDALGV